MSDPPDSSLLPCSGLAIRAAMRATNSGGESDIRYRTVHPTRRQLLKTAIAGTAGILSGAPALRLLAAPQAGSEIPGNDKLADDLYIVRVPGEAAVVAHTGPEGVLLVDGGSA